MSSSPNNCARRPESASSTAVTAAAQPSPPATPSRIATAAARSGPAAPTLATVPRPRLAPKSDAADMRAEWAPPGAPEKLRDVMPCDEGAPSSSSTPASAASARSAAASSRPAQPSSNRGDASTDRFRLRLHSAPASRCSKSLTGRGDSGRTRSELSGRDETPVFAPRSPCRPCTAGHVPADEGCLERESSRGLTSLAMPSVALEPRVAKQTAPSSRRALLDSLSKPASLPFPSAADRCLLRKAGADMADFSDPDIPDRLSHAFASWGSWRDRQAPLLGTAPWEAAALSRRVQ
mmetsp:Transcript_24274/g.91610  ORF Transcript_24274/g.91610 Transcript_24274/m.91610 type:complete len:293 (-) Transcript_24274:935-1813(-)